MTTQWDTVNTATTAVHIAHQNRWNTTISSGERHTCQRIYCWASINTATLACGCTGRKVASTTNNVSLEEAASYGSLSVVTEGVQLGRVVQFDC